MDYLRTGEDRNSIILWMQNMIRQDGSKGWQSSLKNVDSNKHRNSKLSAEAAFQSALKWINLK